MSRLRYLLFLLLALVYPWLVMSEIGNSLEATWLRLLVFSALVLLGTLLLKPARQGTTWTGALLAAMLVYASVYKVAAFIPDITTYPFSLGWSEASRYYYASTFLAEKIYGEWTPLSVLHPSRYLMQAVPFLVSGLPIWVHRAWQVFLWISTSLATGVLINRRLNIQEKFKSFLFTAWVFLFLFQGPLYYHLLVMVILVLWGYDRQRFWRTLLVVLLASAWAGISRINWLPVPGFLAAALYFLEARVGEKGWLKYLIKPALWVGLGTPLAFTVQQLYERFSGNPAEYFGTSFTSDLLWYRLLPSVTYPLGVLPAAILVSLPLLLLMLSHVVVRGVGLGKRSDWQLVHHPVRLLALAGMLGVLGLGGIVVSVKIGGGSNLHNLDAYLVLLLLTGSYFVLGRFREDKPRVDAQVAKNTLLLVLVVGIPVLFAITSGGPIPERDPAAAADALSELRESVNQVSAGSGEVLLIAERHLLAFNELDTNPVIHEYEKVFLMEMAMAGSQAYFDSFYADLNTHRYSLIISNPLWPHYQGRSHSFGEENDAWVRWVVEPLTCAYKEWKTIPEVPLVLLVPNENVGACP